MKLLTLTLVIAVDDEDDQPAPVPKTNDNPLDSLLKRLLLEASRGRSAKLPEDTPYGPIFTI